MSDKDKHRYDDIINLPHHISVKHPQMSAINRAAQFSPFAALTGHEDAILETARLTEEFVELDDSQKEQLDERLQLIQKMLPQKPEVAITYFRPDEKKSGGSYVTVYGSVKNLDAYNHRIILTDGTILPLENLYSIEGELFERIGSLDLNI